jgi:hypothetical protein
MVEIRHGHYEPLLPEIDHEFRELDSRLKLRTEQHKMLVRRRNDLLTTPRPEFLATLEEQQALEKLDALDAELGDADDATSRRIRRLRGVITWTLETEYHERLAQFDANLERLGEAMIVARAQYDEFVRARQAATHSYVGYEQPVRRLRARVSRAIQQVDLLMARQGRDLEVAAVEELVARRNRLEDYRDRVRFALADSYDRATQSQARRLEQ